MKHLRVLALTLLSVAISCSKPENPDELTPAPPVTEEKTYVTISDAKFKTYLLSKFDSDKDGGISDSEALAVKDIDCRNLSIASLSGIRCFINLETLNCSGNELNSLALCAASTKGIVTEGNCSKLKTVDCSGNKITSIEISACSGLKSLNASNNQLTEIDLSGNTSLTNLDVSDNSLTYLDLSGNMSIANVDCSGNEDLKTVTVPEGSSADVKTDEGVTVVENTFSITPDNFDLDAAGGDVMFTVTSSIGYKVTNNNPDWISEVSVKDGETANSKVYTYSVAKNEQTKARTGIIVVCNDKEVCIPVTIKQAAVEEDVFSITPDKFDVEATGGEVTFTVTSSIGYKVTNNNPDWISEVSVQDGPTANSKVYTYSVAKNEQTKARTGIIVVCNDNEVCIPVTIKQAAAEEDVFSITPDNFDLDAAGGDVMFTVTSSIGYKVTNNNPDWITEVSVKDGPTANSKVYTYSVAKNEQTKARTGIIVVCNDNEVCIPVTIKQAAAEEQGGGLKVSKTDFYVNAAGEDIDFTVQSEADYNVKSKVDWVTLKSSDKATGHYCFTVAENAGDDSRTGEITITDANQDKCTLTVHQDGKQGQQDKSWYDKEFAHKSLAMRFTATWCGYCPRLAKSFTEAQGKLPGEIEVLNLHGDGSNLEFDQNGQLENQYQVTGFPSGIIDGRRFVDNGTKDVSNVVVSYAKETVEKYNTVSGISFESSISGQQLTVNVKAYLKKADDYKITAIVTESGMVGYQADYDEGDHWDYHHDDVARIALSNVLGDSFSTTEDAVVKEFTYKVTIPQDYVKENLKIVVYIQRSFGSSPRIQDNRSYGNYYMDNCVSGKAGESIPLAFKSNGSGGNEGIGDGGEIKW